MRKNNRIRVKIGILCWTLFMLIGLSNYAVAYEVACHRSTTTVPATTTTSITVTTVPITTTLCHITTIPATTTTMPDIPAPEFPTTTSALTALVGSVGCAAFLARKK